MLARGKGLMEQDEAAGQEPARAPDSARSGADTGGLFPFDESVLAGLAKHEFLSEAWLEEFDRLTRELGAGAVEVPVALRMNQLIRETPFGPLPIEAHVDTTSGHLEIGLGLLRDPDLSISVDYETAKAMFVDMDPQRAVEAFLAGRVTVNGDITKLLGLAQALASRDERVGAILRAITS